VLQTAIAGQPRFDFSPTTGESLGLLVEEQRTNLKTYSQDILTTNGYNTASATLTAASSTTPISGVTTATKFALNSGADTGNSQTGWNFGSGVTLTASTVHTQSVYVKSDGANIFRLRSNVSGQVFDIPIAGPSPSPSGAVTACSVQQVGNGWVRISWTFTSGASGVPATRSDYWACKSEVNDGVGGYLIVGAQLEAGAFPTSYIPTVAATVTRNADAATMTGVNFSSWYRADEGTFQVSFITPVTTPSGTFPVVLAAHDGTTNNRILLSTNGFFNCRVGISTGGVSESDYNAGSFVTANNLAIWNLAYKTNDQAASANGNPVQTDTSVLIPTVNQLGIGNRPGGTNCTGYIRRIAYYPVRLSNDQLQALTR